MIRELIIKKIGIMSAYGDSAVELDMLIQDPATPLAEGIIKFHHELMIVMIFVVVFVGWMLGRAIYHFNSDVNKVSDGVVHGTLIEIVWTIMPGVILMIIAVPSFSLLYAVDEIVDASMTVKVVGHQWYWSYEYSDECNREIRSGGSEEGIEFDSYMLGEDDLEEGELRLLEVDNRMCIPVDTHVRVIVTGADVLHSWAMPSFGVKIDACPGRLNEVNFLVKRPGVYYGQCSELCGVNHAYMPIVVEVLEMEEYLDWVEKM